MDLNLDSVINAEDELELRQRVAELVQQHGAEHFVFVSLQPSDFSSTRTTHRFLIGCSSRWCQLYNENHWYLTDPCLEYARANTAPVTGANLPIQTDGQRRMLDVAADNGFRSIYIVPAHTSEQGRIGVLYLGSSEQPIVGEARFRTSRSFFRALALELLDCTTRMKRIDVIQKCGLTQEDVKLLARVRLGFKASEIANELGVSVKTVYRQFKVLHEKTGTTNITVAVKFAEDNDIFA
ncbi:autoinducer binding domain-containing protein [Burkholderia stagnalis]